MKVDAVRRPPVGKPTVYAADVDMAEASRMLNRREVDVLWPVGLARTLEHLARLVLIHGPHDACLSPGKQPIHGDWPHRQLTLKEVEAHVNGGGNVGMRAGDGLVILDFDDPLAEREMMATFGALEPTVVTGSGKRHYYVAAPAGLEMPAKLKWRGEVVGEVQRTRGQQVVAPPSIHPDTEAPYRWAGAPTPLATLPEAWLEHFRIQDVPPALRASDLGARPAWVLESDERGHEADTGPEWDGPPAEVIFEAASKQPGAKRRAGGWKFQCPGCHDEGHDKHRDNAIVRNDGRWGCAVNSAHTRAIGRALGVDMLFLIDAPDGANIDPTHPHDGPDLDSPDGPLIDGPDGPFLDVC